MFALGSFGMKLASATAEVEGTNVPFFSHHGVTGSVEHKEVETRKLSQRKHWSHRVPGLRLRGEGR